MVCKKNTDVKRPAFLLFSRTSCLFSSQLELTCLEQRHVFCGSLRDITKIPSDLLSVGLNQFRLLPAADLSWFGFYRYVPSGEFHVASSRVYVD